MEGFVQCVELCEAIFQVDRHEEEEDLFIWPCTSSGSFSASSTYEWLCQGGERFATASCIWKSKATLKCKIFQWLAVKNRLWTTDRRARHGLQGVPNACFLCLQETDTVDHILVQCPYARSSTKALPRITLEEMTLLTHVVVATFSCQIFIKLKLSMISYIHSQGDHNHGHGFSKRLNPTGVY